MQGHQPAGAALHGSPELAAAAAPAPAAAQAAATAHTEPPSDEAGGAEAGGQPPAAPAGGGDAADAAPGQLQAAPGAEQAPSAEQGQGPPQGLHHLTRHWLPEEARGGEAVLERLGAPDVKAAEQMIRWVLGAGVLGAGGCVQRSRSLATHIRGTCHAPTLHACPRRLVRPCRTWGQRDLRDAFQRVYGAATQVGGRGLEP